MPPRHRSRATDPLTRIRNEMDALGRPGMAGTTRIDGGRRGRGGGLADSVLKDDGPAGEETSGDAQLLVMSATGAVIESGGAFVDFDSVVAQHGFDGVAQPHGGQWVHPVSAVYIVSGELTWKSYLGGGNIRVEVDGASSPEKVIADADFGDAALGVVAYWAPAGSVGRIRVRQDSDVAQECDAMVWVAVSDPTETPGTSHLVAGSWTKVFSADVWDLTWDGSHWWTTNGMSTVTKRDGAGTSVGSWHSGMARARGISFDGTDLWVAGERGGNDEVIRRYDTDGSLLQNIKTGPSSDGNDGIAWDGSAVWMVENAKKALENWSTAGAEGASTALAAGKNHRGVAFHDGLLYVVNATDGTLAVYNTSGTLVDTIDTSDAAPALTGVYIATDGTLYVSRDGDGVYVRDTAV